jgi:hypothetical protein
LRRYRENADREAMRNREQSGGARALLHASAAPADALRTLRFKTARLLEMPPATSIQL